MQFKPPSQSGWGQPEPGQQQSFPEWQQQPSIYVPPPPPQQTYFPLQQPDQYYQQQQQTQYPPFPQQPQYPVPGQKLPTIPMPPQMKPKKPVNKKLGIGCGVAVAVFVLIIAISVAAQGNSPSSTSTTPAAQTTPTTSDQPTSAPTTQPTTPPTVAPPTPTLSAAQQESAYKASTTDTTVTTLDKDGNADAGNDVHFTADILNFVKDSSGNTAGANLDDANGGSGVVQIAFPSGTDISQLNVGDVVEVWGNDQGTASGQNAFGATIQEVVISANYLTDKTTGYQTN